MINKVILLGNVGADPEVHVFESGNKIVRIRLATTERVFNPSTSVWSDHTEWHQVIVGQRHSNFAEMYIKKGSQVYVEGKLRRREWGEADDKRFSYEIRVDEIRLLGRRSESSENSYATQNSSQTAAPQQSQTPQESYQPPQQQYIQQSQPASNPIETTTDDLPF